jgi:hypothetical protein
MELAQGTRLALCCLSHSPILNMEAVCSFETAVNCWTAQVSTGLAVAGCLTRHQEVVSNRHGACWSSDTREKRVGLHAATFPTVQLNRVYKHVTFDFLFHKMRSRQVLSYKTVGRCSSVYWWTSRWMALVHIPAGTFQFLPRHFYIHSDSGALAVTCSGYQRFVYRGQCGWCMKPTISHHLVQKSVIHGPITPRRNSAICLQTPA